jgi:hypothetical protein
MRWTRRIAPASTVFWIVLGPRNCFWKLNHDTKKGWQRIFNRMSVGAPGQAVRQFGYKRAPTLVLREDVDRTNRSLGVGFLYAAHRRRNWSIEGGESPVQVAGELDSGGQ